MDLRKHFEHTHYLVQQLGAGEFGEAWLAINRSTANDLHTQLHDSDRPRFYKNLRANLVVVKFSKDDIEDDDLSHEINFLTQGICKPSPRILELLYHHDHGWTQWLVAPFYPGGDLYHFTRAFPQAITVSFVWHVVYQLTEAVLFLFFGTTDVRKPKQPEEWPYMFHGDFHDGNVLLRQADPQSGFGNYPDVILSDFGTGEIHNDPEMKNVMKVRQLRDIQGLAIILQTLPGVLGLKSKSPEGKVLFGWVDKLLLFPSKINEVDWKEQLLGTLLGLVKTADHERRKYYQPLGPDAEASLSSTKVSDAALNMLASQINMGKKITLQKTKSKRKRTSSHRPRSHLEEPEAKKGRP